MWNLEGRFFFKSFRTRFPSSVAVMQGTRCKSIKTDANAVFSIEKGFFNHEKVMRDVLRGLGGEGGKYDVFREVEVLYYVYFENFCY